MAAEHGDEDPLEALREQLERTQEAARQLAREAAEAAAGATRRPPAAGWQTSAGEAGPAPASELTALVRLFDSLREVIPAELVERFVAVVRELLKAVRALIDYVLERMEVQRTTPDEVQDIPIL